MAAHDLKSMVTVTELDDLLQCPVCYEVPAGHIYQCNQGHHVCGDCKTRIDLCPVCRSMFFGTRNYAMEELISNIKKLKLSKNLPLVPTNVPVEPTSEATTGSTHSSNSTLGLTDTDRIENESPRPAPVMCSGLFRCLCCASTRKERLPIARMLNHLRYWHSLDLVEGKLESEQYEQAWEIPMDAGRIVLAVRVIELGVYFLVIEIHDNPMEMHAWLSMVASPLEADKYNYSITLTASDREATFSDAAMSVRSCEGQLKKRRRCLFLDSTNMRAFFDSQVVSVRLCVKRATERRDEMRSEPRAALRIANRSLSDAGSTNSINSPDRLLDRNINHRIVELSSVELLPNNNVHPVRNNQQNARNTVPEEPVRYPTLQANRTAPGSAAGNSVTAATQAAPVASQAQLSRSARRRLRRRLNMNALAAVAASDQSRPVNIVPSPEVVHIGYLRVEPVNSGRLPVAPQNPANSIAQQNGGSQASARHRRSRARR